MILRLRLRLRSTAYVALVQSNRRWGVFINKGDNQRSILTFQRAQESQRSRKKMKFWSGTLYSALRFVSLCFLCCSLVSCSKEETSGFTDFLQPSVLKDVFCSIHEFKGQWNISARKLAFRMNFLSCRGVWVRGLSRANFTRLIFFPPF